MDQPRQEPFGQVPVGQAAGHQCRGFWHGANHQCRLRDHAERAQRADHQLAQIVPGGVFDHASAGGECGPPAVHRPDADHVVADGSVCVSPRAAGVGGQQAADGRPVGLWNVDRQALPLVGQAFGQFGDGDAGLQRDGHVVGRIVDHAIQPAQRESHARAARPRAVIESRPAADRINGHCVASRIAHRAGHGGLVGRCDGFGQGQDLSDCGHRF